MSFYIILGLIHMQACEVLANNTFFLYLNLILIISLKKFNFNLFYDCV